MRPRLWRGVGGLRADWPAGTACSPRFQEAFGKLGAGPMPRCFRSGKLVGVADFPCFSARSAQQKLAPVNFFEPTPRQSNALLVQRKLPIRQI